MNLSVWIALVTTLVAQEAPPEAGDPVVESGRPVSFRLDATAPALPLSGRSRRFNLVTRPNGAVFVWVDVPRTRVRLKIRMERSGRSLENDETYPSPFPFILETATEADRWVITISSSSRDDLIEGSLHVWQSAETEETHQLADALAAQRALINQLIRSRRPNDAREQLLEDLHEVRSALERLDSYRLVRELEPWCSLAWNLGATEVALEFFLARLAFFERVAPPDCWPIQVALQNVGACLVTLDRALEALPYQDRNVASRLRTYRSNDLRVLEAHLHRAVGWMHADRLEPARAALLEVIRTGGESPAASGIASLARVNLAAVLTRQGSLLEAHALYRALLKNPFPKDGSFYTTFGACLAQLRDFEAARTTLDRAVALLQEQLPEGHPRLSDARLNLATTLNALGEPEAARELLERVLANRLENHPDSRAKILSTRLALLPVHARLGDFQRIEELLQSLEHESESDPLRPKDRDTIRSFGARASLQAGNLDRAQQLLESILDAEWVNTRPASEVASDWAQLTEIHLRRGDLDAARAAHERLLATISSILESSRGRAPRERQSTAQFGIQSLHAALSLTQELGADVAALRTCFELIEEARSVETQALQTLAAREAQPQSREIQGEIQALNSRISLAAARDIDSETLLGWVLDRDALLEKLHGIEDPVKASPEMSFERLVAKLEPTDAVISFRRVIRQIIDPKDTRWRGHWTYLAFVARADGSLHCFDLGPTDRIENAIEFWRSTLLANDPGADPGRRGLQLRAGTRLREVLLDPLEPALGGTTRWFVTPDDALHLVPFDALPDPGDDLVGDRISVISLITPGDLLLEAPRKVLSPSLLVVGDIGYGATAGPGSGSGTPSGRGAVVTSLVSESRIPFSALPGTRLEIATIADRFRDRFEPTSVRVLRGSEATRDAFEIEAPRARFVHVATHGFFAPESMIARWERTLPDSELAADYQDVRGLSPMVLCGFVFAGANGPPDLLGRNAAWMTGEELASIDLAGCELFVLSGCETSVGIRRIGQGVASLQQAAYAAGARASITSMWPVSDEATQVLMTELYDRLWNADLDWSTALWQAKRSLREALDDRGRPRFSVRDWAGWKLTGVPE